MQEGKRGPRETSTVRLYVDTIRKLRILAEGAGQTMQDYLDGLVDEAVRRDGVATLAALSAALDRPL
jgi:hypothetical protein